MLETDPFGDTSSTMVETAQDISGMFEGGAPTCKFQKIGDVHKGIITDCKERQQTDMDTGEPEVWKDGNPKMMVVMTIQTAERDPEIDDDDGTRKIYMKRPSGIYNAFIHAVKAAKSKPAIGGTVAFKYVKDGVPPKRGYNAPKEFVAVYAPPGVPLNTAPGAAPAAPIQSTGNINDDQKKLARISAFRAFQTKMPNLNADNLAAVWKDACRVYFPNRDLLTITPAQWQNFITNDFVPMEDPIANSPYVFTADDIPI